jgi:HTH-type transcriptional regulator/antitoxin HigA
MTTGLKKPSNYYIELMTVFPPRPITNKAELLATQQRINSILDTRNLTQDDRDYLIILGLLVYEYEEKYESMPELTDRELLQGLMEEYNLQIQDFLNIFDTKETIIQILEGKKSINSQEFKKIAELEKFVSLKNEAKNN